MEAEAARAKYKRIHEQRPWHDGNFEDTEQWTEKPTSDTPYHYTWGVEIDVTPVDLDPEGTWLGASAEDPADDAPEHGDRE